MQLEVPRAGGPQTCGWRRTPLSAGGAHGVRTDLRRETLSWSRRAGVSPPRDLSRGKGAVLPDPPFQGHSRRTRRQDPNPPAHSPGLPRPSGGAETHTVSASRAGSGLDLSSHRFPHLQAPPLLNAAVCGRYATCVCRQLRQPQSGPAASAPPRPRGLLSSAYFNVNNFFSIFRAMRSRRSLERHAGVASRCKSPDSLAQ